MIPFDSKSRLLERIKLQRVRDELSGELATLATQMAAFLKETERA